jgi:FKBP-type peptidyl-prolyl cis-trans isomerase FkpA
MRWLLALGMFALIACSGGDPGPDTEPAGETNTASGLTISHLSEGSGASPTATDVVLVHYHGTFPDGKVFDSSVERGKPARFPLNRVIPCWTQGLQQMRVGGKAKLVCPPGIAYGARGAPPRIPPNATLHFDVELLAIE